MERLFSHRQDGEACECVLTDAGRSSDAKMTFLHGPPRCGKSSLALQYAFELVKRSQDEEAMVVLVLHVSTKGNRHRVVPVDPCESCNTPVKTGQDMIYWNRIRIKYLENASQLRHFVCSFHMFEGINTALIVDDLDMFCTAPAQIYPCMAFLKETMEYMRSKFNSGLVLVLGTSQAFPRELRRTLRRWCELILQIEKSNNDAFSIHEETWKSEVDWADILPLFPVTYRIDYTFTPDSPTTQGHLQIQRVDASS
ncbi:hypothetical protein THRCLA_01509 [Thraustotheca clavata]|uniref:ATPase AAA-type core domain-containing protein n=1 Tax=Thraustotheca clavata TaxID=74557 RepID=A0A1W0A8B7_9STRA|nr:hypothetical protein THRCLA_01509 [Thraustotheca clavata]